MMYLSAGSATATCRCCYFCYPKTESVENNGCETEHGVKLYLTKAFAQTTDWSCFKAAAVGFGPDPAQASP